MNVFVDGIKIYSNHYNKSIGNLVGIRYRFIGAINVSDLEVTDAITNSVVLKENFRE